MGTRVAFSWIEDGIEHGCEEILNSTPKEGEAVCLELLDGTTINGHVGTVYHSIRLETHHQVIIITLRNVVRKEKI